MNQAQLIKIIEAALMVSDKPMNVNQLLDLFEKDVEPPAKPDVRAALTELQSDYLDRGVELKEVANGFRFQVKAEYADWVNRLYDERPPRYSRALLETLAIIAYRQPITRGEIEDIRGVSVSTNIIKTMYEREWIKVVGHRDVPGKPELIATTKQFLDYFNLKKLSDLPSLAEIKDFEQLNPDLFDALDAEQVEAAEKQPENMVNVELVTEDVPDDESQQSIPEDQSHPEETPVEIEERDPDDNVVPFSG